MTFCAPLRLKLFSAETEDLRRQLAAKGDEGDPTTLQRYRERMKELGATLAEAKETVKRLGEEVTNMKKEAESNYKTSYL